MQSIRNVQRLNDLELEKCVPPNASWHTDYRDTAYIYIGGLPFELSEGDILTIFSQYGNPVHINLMRDKETGKSRGFCFLKYEDQRSCDLAVDNLSGAGVLGRVLSVDHTRYTLKEGEVEGQGLEESEEADDGDVTDRGSDGGRRRRKRRRTESESEEERPLLKEEVELAKLLKQHDVDDPMKAYLVEEKRAEVEEARRKAAAEKENQRRRKHRHRDERREYRSRRQLEDDRDGEQKRIKDRADGDRERHRSRRDRSEEEDRQGHRSRNERSVSRDSARDRLNSRRKRDDSEEDQGRDGHKEERRRRQRSLSDRSHSREPYKRTRS